MLDGFMKLILKCKMNECTCGIFFDTLEKIFDILDRPAGLEKLRKRSFKASNSQDAILYNKGS